MLAGEDHYVSIRFLSPLAFRAHQYQLHVSMAVVMHKQRNLNDKFFSESMFHLLCKATCNGDI